MGVPAVYVVGDAVLVSVTWGAVSMPADTVAVAVAVDAQENLYVAEYGSNDRVQVFTREGKFLRAFGAFGTKPGDCPVAEAASIMFPPVTAKPWGWEMSSMMTRTLPFDRR